MLRESDVQHQIESLRENQISLADFENWAMSVAWNLHKKAPDGSRVYDVIRDIEGYLFEYQQGEYNEDELRQALFSLG
jgi:hypothetical protein